MNNRIREIVENIKDSYKGSLLYEEPMSFHTTMGVGGPATLFALPETEEALFLLLSECKKNDIRFFVVGGGSNLIVEDKGFLGVIICTESLSSIELKDNLVVCGSGAKTNDVVSFFAENGLSGLECFAGLPGTVGGACFMNARCYSCDIGEKIEWVEYIDCEKIRENQDFFLEKDVKIYHNIEGLGWAYKHSPFMMKETIITKVAFKAGKPSLDKVGEIKEECERFIKDREQKGHFRARSAGSVFKNNRDFGESSGQLIDKVGLKGTKIGGAQIAPWHGNIIINTGNASCSDIKSLVQLAREKVREKTGFSLECEVVFI